MPEHHRWDPVRRPPVGLVRPVPVDPSGCDGPTRGQAAGSRWRRTSHGLYVPASVDDAVPEQRIVEQAARLPPQGAVTGWAACLLHGAALLDGLLPDGTTRQPVPLAVGPNARIAVDSGVRLSRDRLDAAERTVRRGIPCVTVGRAVFDAMRTAVDLREAVVVMDMVAAAELTSVSRMREYLRSRSGWAGVGQVQGRARPGQRAQPVPERDTAAAGLGARRRPAHPGGEPPGLRPRTGGCWASRTCSTWRQGSSVSTTAPTTGPSDGTPGTWRRRTRCASTASRWSG